MNKNTTRQFDPNVIAVLHRTGRVWRSVVARLSPKNAGTPRLVAHREFSPAETSRLASWIDEHSAGRIAVVLHASAVICRTCSLPDAPEDQLGPALRLQAEAHLFGIAPPHRMGMAVLEAAPGETSRSGIVLAWPEHRPGNRDANDSHRPPLSEEQLAGRTVHYTPDVAALASLLNGQRPTHPLAWVDREDGSLALAVTHANGAVFRGLREDAADAEEWKASVGRVLAETCLSVGHTSSFIESLVNSMRERLDRLSEGESQLIAPQEVIENAAGRLENVPQDEKWWASYGIAAGVVIAAGGALASLTELRESVPIRHATTLDRALTALSSRTAAVAAVAACIAVLMFGPLVVNAARLAILKAKYPQAELDEQIADVRTISNQLVMYRELDRGSWSMTKILSDIVSNTPQGIELDHIRVSPTRTFNVQGRAIPHGGLSATEIVGVMRQYLDDSGIFRDTSLQWRDPDAYGNYQFTLSASIAEPYRQYDYPEELDFMAKTLGERMWGPRAAPDWRKPVEVADADDGGVESPAANQDVGEIVSGMLAGNPEAEGPESEDSSTGRRGGRTQSRIGDQAPLGGSGNVPGAARIDDRGNIPTSAPGAEAPPPLTHEQILAMSDSEVRDMLTRVAAARRRTDAQQDAELSARLKQEFEWLMDRTRNRP